VDLPHPFGSSALIMMLTIENTARSANTATMTIVVHLPASWDCRGPLGSRRWFRRGRHPGVDPDVVVIIAYEP